MFKLKPNSIAKYWLCLINRILENGEKNPEAFIKDRIGGHSPE